MFNIIWSFSKCKLKPQWDNSQPERLLSINRKSASVGEDLEKREPWCTVGIANWFRHYEKQYEESSNAFSVPFEMIIWFLYFVNLIYHIYWFRYVEPSLHSSKKISLDYDV